MKDNRYLTFEISPSCNMDKIHPRCPINDPERYQFGLTDKVLDDDTIFAFWMWAVKNGFKGIVLWHLYNEPSLNLSRIEELVRRMKEVVPSQQSHLWTNGTTQKNGPHDHLVLTNYHIVRPTDLDNRRASTRGEGKPYEQVEPVGHCGRGYGWEAIIDYHGNWNLCCNDWRCEGSFGNIFVEDWDLLLEKYNVKAHVRWNSKETYDALPRMCRSCMDVNPNLHKTALPPPGVQW